MSNSATLPQNIISICTSVCCILTMVSVWCLPHCKFISWCVFCCCCFFLQTEVCVAIHQAKLVLNLEYFFKNHAHFAQIFFICLCFIFSLIHLILRLQYECYHLFSQKRLAVSVLRSGLKMVNCTGNVNLMSFCLTKPVFQNLVPQS